MKHSKFLTKPIPVAEILEERFGGKWVYDKKAHTWFQKGTKAYACYVANLSDDDCENRLPPRLCAYRLELPIKPSTQFVQL